MTAPFSDWNSILRCLVVYVCVDILNMHAFVSVCICQHSQNCQWTSTSNLVLFCLLLATVPSFKWPFVSPCASPSYLWALNSVTAVHFTASPPAILLITLLSSAVTHNPTYSSLFYFVQHRSKLHLHFSKHNSEAARHSWVRDWVLLCKLSNHQNLAHVYLFAKRHWWRFKCISGCCYCVQEKSNMVILRDSC